MLSAVRAAVAEMPMGRLEEALRGGSWMQAEAALEASFAALETGLRGAEAADDMRAAAANDGPEGVEDVLSDTMAAGGEAAGLCVPETRFDVTVLHGVPKAQAEKVRAALDGLPESFKAKTGAPRITVRADGIPGHPNANGLMRYQSNEIEVRTGGGQLRGPEQVLRHELGHAFDGKVGASSTKAFRDAFAQDMRGFGKRPEDLFVKHYALNEREAFAQSVAMLSGRVGDRAAFAKAFKNSIAAARDILLQHGVAFT